MWPKIVLILISTLGVMSKRSQHTARASSTGFFSKSLWARLSCSIKYWNSRETLSLVTLVSELPSAARACVSSLRKQARSGKLLTNAVTSGRKTWGKSSL